MQFRGWFVKNRTPDPPGHFLFNGNRPHRILNLYRPKQFYLNTSQISQSREGFVFPILGFEKVSNPSQAFAFLTWARSNFCNPISSRGHASHAKL